MKKIVQYIPALVNGGIEAMLLNYYQKINDEYEFIIIAHGEIESTCREKFENLGAKIYKIPHWFIDFLNHNKKLYDILRTEQPQIFHSHHGIYNFLPCLIAKIAKVKIRISHSHAYFPKKNIKEKIFCTLNKFFCTNLAACGIGAAKYLTNDNYVQKGKVKIIYNAIDLNKFKFNESKRKKIRKEYGYEENVIYGNVGRFSLQKNQLFLVDIYEKIFEFNPKARFFIIGGDGELYNDICAKIKKSTIKEVCIILKNISNVNEFYSAMDFLVLPSLFEGFAVTVVEAQATNLPCVLSPTITKEFSSSNIYYSKSLEKIDDWIKIIKTLKVEDRRNKVKKLDKFDIDNSYVDLKKYYNNLIGGNKNDKRCNK